jgi:hypothetical protein
LYIKTSCSYKLHLNATKAIGRNACGPTVYHVAPLDTLKPLTNINADKQICNIASIILTVQSKLINANIGNEDDLWGIMISSSYGGVNKHRVDFF